MKEYEIGIIGAGPGGSTCAHYLASAGKQVAIFERHRFPRDKICGDAIVPRAQIHLERMGLLPRLIEEGKARPARRGGFVSPGGIRAVGDSTGFMALRPVLSIKRMILDEQLARAAQRAGADLIEGCRMTRATQDEATGKWTLMSDDGEPYRVTALIAADGSNSRIARSLGLVTEHPTAFCSRAYISGGSHLDEIDGMAFYRPDLLPGYSAIFREADDDLVFCCYLMPGAARQPEDLRELHNWFLHRHPDVRRFVGDHAMIEKMRSGPLRIGGIPKSYARGFLAVGDAAGQIDPLSGEGIQFAMDAAEIAANTLVDAFAKGDLSEASLKPYQERWMRNFGHDFKWSARIASLLTKRPGLLDISAKAAMRKGGLFFQAWSQIMTGEKPKIELFRPGIILPIVEESLRDAWRSSPVRHVAS